MPFPKTQQANQRLVLHSTIPLLDERIYRWCIGWAADAPNIRPRTCWYEGSTFRSDLTQKI